MRYLNVATSVLVSGVSDKDIVGVVALLSLRLKVAWF